MVKEKFNIHNPIYNDDDAAREHIIIPASKPHWDFRPAQQ